jgi:hypothetical protein
MVNRRLILTMRTQLATGMPSANVVKGDQYMRTDEQSEVQEIYEACITA